MIPMEAYRRGDLAGGWQPVGRRGGVWLRRGGR
jgi:hypothetical protein